MQLVKLLKQNYVVVILVVLVCLMFLGKGKKGCRAKPVVS